MAIGDSNLVSSAKSGIVHDLSSEVSGAQHQAEQLRSQLSSEETFVNDLYPIAVHGLLSGRNVGLVFLGPPSNGVNGYVREAVTQAGGDLATVIAVREPLDLAGIARLAEGRASPGSLPRPPKSKPPKPPKPGKAPQAPARAPPARPAAKARPAAPPPANCSKTSPRSSASSSSAAARRSIAS